MPARTTLPMLLVCAACAAPGDRASRPSASALGALAQDRGVPVLVLTDPGALAAVRAEVESAGGRVRLQVPPSMLAALVPTGAEDAVADVAGVRLVATTDAPDPAAVAAIAPDLDWVIPYWRRQVGIDRPAMPAGAPPLVGDARMPAGPVTRDSADMKGKVAIAVILLESDGTKDASIFNWSSQQISKVKSGLADAWTWWDTTGDAQGLTMNPAAQHYVEVVNVSVEPLNGNYASTDECIWIGEAMHNLGFDGDCPDVVTTFNESIRQANGADHAYTVFIANDGDGYGYPRLYSDGFIAWAMWGGPLAMVSYNNGGYGIDYLGQVVAHESAHIFHALDEYSEPGYAVCACSGFDPIAGESEYNGCPNDNCRLANGSYCKTHQSCIMGDAEFQAWDKHALCDATKCHIGWVCTPERCDYRDNDCNGQTDEEGAIGCTNRWLDADSDWYGTGSPRCLCEPEGQWRALKGGDCDDSDGQRNPGAKEKCDGIDNDCDGVTDPEGSVGCTNVWTDADGDGYGSGAPHCVCNPAAGLVTKGGDCDDANPAIHPGATEVCNGIDDDCDGSTDPDGSNGCVVTLLDADGDGYGVTGSEACRCLPAGKAPVKTGGDCDDGNPAVHPGATEACNGVDDDCNGMTDEGDACSEPKVDEAVADEAVADEATVEDASIAEEVDDTGPDEATAPGPDEANPPAEVAAPQPKRGGGCAAGGEALPFWPVAMLFAVIAGRRARGCAR